MTTISFNVFKRKVVSGEKLQTIREKKTDHWLRLRKGDPVQIYWKQRSRAESEKLFESELSEDPFVVQWKDFTDDLMIGDGFKSVKDGNSRFFIPKYGRDGETIPDKEFVVLRWKKPGR